MRRLCILSLALVLLSLCGCRHEGDELTVKGNNDGTPITVILDSKLKNGKELLMKIVSPSYKTN